MDKTIKLVVLANNQILITQIEEVGSEIGEPDCKLISPYITTEQQTLEPFLCGYTREDTFMISSDKIIPLADPTPTLLEKYQDLLK